MKHIKYIATGIIFLLVSSFFVSGGIAGKGFLREKSESEMFFWAMKITTNSLKRQ